MRNILVPIDFSDHSLHALGIASGLAAEQDAALALLHIWTSGIAFHESSPPAVVLAAREEVARRRLESLEPSRPNVRVERYLGSGPPADEILRFTTSHATDVIVMGSHGQIGAARRAVGNVAEAVLRRAACPVLMCRLPAPFDLGTAALWPKPTDGQQRPRMDSCP